MTITLDHVMAEHNGDFLRLVITLSDGEHAEKQEMRLSAEQYTALRPVKGPITEDVYDRLSRAAAISEAYAKAMSILAYGANTKQTLVTKLRRRGIDADTARAVAELAAAKGYLDEERDMERAWQQCLKKGWGARRITAYMRQRGYGAEALACLPERLSGVDFDERCAALLAKTYDTLPSDPRERQKAAAFLMRYGYSADEIRYAFSRWRED